MFLPAVSFGLEFSYIDYNSSIDGTVTNQTVTIASHTATILNVGHYAEVQISSATSQYFYRVDGSTLTVQASGYPVAAAATASIKSIKGKVVLQNVAGAASQTLRAIITEPR
jgi:hypothetical protein